MVTGVDLVAEQLRVAAGEPLGFDPAELRLTGHAIEVRINAEDPYSGFLPSTGTLHNLRAPGGPWVRLDSSMYRGLEVGLSYDPMLGKLIVWGADRDQAIRRMQRAIAEMNVGGVRTSLPAALQVLETSEFGAGEYDTHFLESLQLAPPQEFEPLVAAASAIFRHTQSRRRALEPQHASRNAWRDRGRRSVSSFSRRASEKGDQA
jgi:acetyl-CoA carboxylase biotin carboxylase subunit